MNKKILVLYYSQTGQLSDILNSYTEPLIKAGNSVEFVRVHPQTEYSFPWSGKSFFAVMPDSIHRITTPLKPFELKETKYDLIIFGYQAWFLSPSIPANSLLQDPRVRAVMKDTPVITITGARNMWISALEKIKVTFKEIGAKHAGNIVLVDKHHNLISFITIFRWMFKDKKEQAGSIWPASGVSKADIEHTKVFGEITNKHLQNGEWSNLQNELFANKAVIVKYNLMYTESKAVRLFGIWGNLIVKRKNRDPWLVAFKYYIIIALFIAAPLIITVHTIFFRPFMRSKTKKQLAYYAGVN